ncbi:phosphotransferase family protein [Chamaesiphon minutus]|uniref:Putative aminoglycoside phosphotransferase n=1 Tax=Chamaesiphon minutus (strain ATCC 27169 / PCC 6605) TaxID=1173020 RepID=K9UPL1_CHAP6|nr:aminoglycoside phosphotransferase family protein [Chamaesiphon minutus]AFY97027.1 putative aminoglycoside phosphotransferase [Chamaesiphon minutus PCC 6605]
MKIIDSQNSDVAILGNIVIRRPRHAEAIAGVCREATVLPLLRDRLILPVPHMQLVEVGDEIITLHQQLPGEPLCSVQNLNDSIEERLATQLGSFLKSLHEIEPVVLSNIDLPQIDRRWWTNLLNKAERFVFPKVASTTAELLRSQIQSHIEQLPSLPCVLRHGDFGSSNILWDGEKNITGIVDFGSLGWGDPGWDIAGLFVSYGSSFVERLTSTYPAIDSLLERLPFYESKFALMEAIFGAEHSDREALNSGLDMLKQIV